MVIKVTFMLWTCAAFATGRVNLPENLQDPHANDMQQIKDHMQLTQQLRLAGAHRVTRYCLAQQQVPEKYASQRSTCWCQC